MTLPLFTHGGGVQGETIGCSRFFGMTVSPLLREVYRSGHVRGDRGAQRGGSWGLGEL